MLLPISLNRKQESLYKFSKDILLMTPKGQMGKIIQATLTICEVFFFMLC